MYRLLFTFACFCLILPGNAHSAGTTTEIQSGKVEGIAVGEKGDVIAFKGIPYAAPPVGTNRWRTPQPVESWEGTRVCNEFSAACPQPNALEVRYGIKFERMSEDCLYLNVYTPNLNPEQPLPVMVWLYGGGFAVGDASVYDGQHLARKGAVVVTINYRVGVFGFINHPAISREDPRGVSGNYGLMDMVAALEWIQQNIASFGGDPDNVTLFGQSAGASAIVMLMTVPQTKGLFHKALPESHATYRRDYPDIKEVEQDGIKLSETLGIKRDEHELEALRAVSAEKLLEAMSEAGLRFDVILDGGLLKRHPMLVFRAGLQHDIPMLIGSNTAESMTGPTLSTRNFARMQSRVNPDTYRYLFDRSSNDPLFADRGAFHSAEIHYVFNGGTRGYEYFAEDDKKLAELMSAMWVQFARTGNPNLPDQPLTWPQYDKEGKYIVFGEKVYIDSGWNDDALDQIESEYEETLTEWKKSFKP